MQRVRVSSQQSPVFKLGDSQMSLSPKFKLNTLPSTDLETGEPMIPGLPDDIALLCLLRVGFDKHETCKSVCKRWYSLFCSKEKFFTLRKELGFHDPWLFVFAYHRCTGIVQCKVLDLKQFSWHAIPAMPCKDRVCPQGFRCVSVPDEGKVFVLGGVVSGEDCPLNLVLKYEVCKNRWTAMKQMKTGRLLFGTGVINRTVYVAGGNSTDLFELSSGEVLDVKNGVWEPIAEMGTSMAVYDVAVLDGKLYVTEGWFWPFYVVPRGQVYDPVTDSWADMASGLREGWTGSSVVVEGRLFVVPEHERAKVKVYDSENDTWEVVEGAALPEQICKPFCVSSLGRKIYVVGRNLNLAIGHVLKVDKFRVEWEVIDAPLGLFDLAPSSAHVLFA